MTIIDDRHRERFADDVELALADAVCHPECMFYAGPNGGACFSCMTQAVVTRVWPRRHRRRAWWRR